MNDFMLILAIEFIVMIEMHWKGHSVNYYRVVYKKYRLFPV